MYGMDKFDEIKMILMGMSARLERVEQMLQRIPDRVGGDVEPSVFTLRQHLVIQAVVEGWKNDKIAAFMNISPITVKTHLKGAADKLGVSRRAEVATAGAAMLAATDAEEYRRASGGLPIDWAQKAGALERPEDDEFWELYQPFKKG
jgi:DNA-binding CsgD family transcriptional regulator